MKPEAMRVAIAEACGLDVEKQNPALWDIHWIKGQGHSVCAKIPDYPNDMNAMREVVANSFNTTQREDFACHLLRIVEGTDYNRSDYLSITGVGFLLTHSTALHYAEAFLRTLGLWKEEE